MNVIDQIYNGCAGLRDLQEREDLSPMDAHRLRTSMFRIRLALGLEQPYETDEAEAAAAYNAGYEDESK